MSSPWKCSGCFAKNAAESTACEHCGVARPAPRQAPAKPSGRKCPVHGAPLDTRAFCEAGQGYPMTAACPIACPHCRHPLTWDGRCFSCFGCTTGKREDWTIPGDRYEVQAGHWRVTEKGPRPIFSRDQNVKATVVVQMILDRLMTEADGHAEIDRIAQEA